MLGQDLFLFLREWLTWFPDFCSWDEAGELITKKELNLISCSTLLSEALWEHGQLRLFVVAFPWSGQAECVGFGN